MSTLIAIPTLNEEDHIEAVLDSVACFARRAEAVVVIADGGSQDRTREIVARRMQHEGWLRLIENPAKFQSAAVNLAVEQFCGACDWLIRIDAHSVYPEDFCDTLIAEARERGADSVVVTMHAVGSRPLQNIIAAAQNSHFGNGAAAHRNTTQGAWVDHGHHALIRIEAFRAIAGYDPDFTHNEDAEFDYRLRTAGFRIWLTAQTHIDYFPRATLGKLMQQYFRFGRGRARTLAKHRLRPARRQMIVAALAPALALTPLEPLQPIFGLPLLVWLGGCAAAGILIARHTGTPANLLAGPVAGLMQLAWSAGYWRQTLGQRSKDHGGKGT